MKFSLYFGGLKLAGGPIEASNIDEAQGIANKKYPPNRRGCCVAVRADADSDVIWYAKSYSKKLSLPTRTLAEENHV